eukprot:gene6689-9173_t
MECSLCNSLKISHDFPTILRSASAAKESYLPHDQLLFVCLECLLTTSILKNALDARTITESEYQAIFTQAQQWNANQIGSVFLKPPKQKSSSKGRLLVSILTGERFEVPVRADSTVKDIKLYLGHEMGDRDPRSIRLTYQGKEIKVKEGNRLISLNEIGIGDGAEIIAIISINSYAGKTHIPGAATDAHGNYKATLGENGGFVGLEVVILCCYSSYPNDLTIIRNNTCSALEKMGFKVTFWVGTPTIDILNQSLATATQIWIISTNSANFIPAGHIEAIKSFHDRGGALYLWGDNDPYNDSVNPVITRVMPGVQLKECYWACNYVNVRKSNTGPGFDGEHYIFTGIVKLYEGHTIARFIGSNPRLKYIMYSTEGNPALGICDDNLGGCGRIAIDVAFTKLYCSWDDAGSAAFVQNIAAWLCGLDADWA